MVARLLAVAVVMLAGLGFVPTLNAWPWAAVGLVGAVCAMFGVRSSRVPGTQGGLGVAAVAGFGLAFSATVWVELAGPSEPIGILAGFFFNFVMGLSGVVAFVLSFGREKTAPKSHKFDPL